MYSTFLYEQVLKEKRDSSEAKRKHLLGFVVPELKKYFARVPVKSVYLTGSLIKPFSFHEHSDIDIATDGLPYSHYFKTISELEEIFRVKVDIIEMENCNFSKKILNTGIKIK
jgi:predicted nucleotidyltransferase